MRVDRPTDRPEDSGESASRPEARPQDLELRDANGLNAAEYIRAWNEKVESGEAEREEAAEERPRREYRGDD